MKNKILCALLSLLMLVACFSLTAFAVEEKEVALVVNCDSAVGSFAVSTAKKTEGRGSYKLSLKDDGFKFANAIPLATAKDISGRDTLAIDFYMSDPLKIANSFSELMIEFTSCGTYDNAEIAFVMHGDLKSAARKMTPGWNTAYFYFETTNRTTNPDPVDLTKINFVRIFGTSIGGEGLSKETLLLDNIRVCNTGGPSCEHLDFEQYRGDNSGVEVETEGMTRPDIDDRQDEITSNAGVALDPADRVVVPDDLWNNDSVSVNGGGVDPDAPSQPSTPDQPSTPTEPTDPTEPDADGDSASTDLTLVLVIVICAAVIVIAAAVLVLVLVLTKTKKKD
jgi:hypothetical protein